MYVPYVHDTAQKSNKYCICVSKTILQLLFSTQPSLKFATDHITQALALYHSLIQFFETPQLNQSGSTE
jgi:hypothetical protein